MNRLARFLRFWWDFVVGDDWRTAAGLAAALLVTWVLERSGVSAWWLLPVAVSLILVGSVRRETRRVARG